MHKVPKHLPLVQLMNSNPIQFQTTQKWTTGATGPTGQRDNRHPRPANKGSGKKASSYINKQLSVSDIFARTSAYPQSRNLGTGHPKMFCTACGGYDHWRKDCPYDCHCDNCDSDSHTTHMCRGTPKTISYPIPTTYYLRLLW